MSRETKHQANTATQRTPHAPRHALKPKALSTVLRICGLVFLALLLTVTSATGTLYYKLQSNVTQHKISLNSTEKSKIPPPIDQKAGQPLNILLLGSDVRSLEQQEAQGIEGMRADTTMLVHISADRSRIDVVSIPRDTLVDIPPCILPNGDTTWAQSDAMFNSAFMLGGSTGDVGAAASCALATVQDMSGITIDGFVVVDFNSFQAVVNSIGGVKMCFKEPIEDPDAHLNLPAGCQTLDGAEALGIARARYSLGDGSDTSRIGRQQELVFQIVKKLFEMNIFTDTQTFYQVASDVTSNLDTSEGLGNLTFLAGLAYSLRNLDMENNLVFATIPHYADPNDPNRVRPALQIDVLWEALRNDETIPAEAVMEQKEQTEVVVGDHTPQSFDSDTNNGLNNSSETDLEDDGVMDNSTHTEEEQ